jgi:hypothetical protein
MRSLKPELHLLRTFGSFSFLYFWHSDAGHWQRLQTQENLPKYPNSFKWRRWNFGRSFGFH